MANNTRPVIEYGICKAHTTAELAGYINVQIKEGFELYESVFQSIQDNEPFFNQAMVKYGIVKKKQVK